MQTRDITAGHHLDGAVRITRSSPPAAAAAARNDTAVSEVSLVGAPGLTAQRRASTPAAALRVVAG